MHRMITLHYFQKKIRDVSWEDLASVFPMIIAWVLHPFYRKKYKNAWLLCENKEEAGDNAYHFFRYIREERQEQDCYYAISSRSKDYSKVSKIGKTIEYGSIKHWLLYFTCRYNISSQKGGKPNAALCSFFELNGLFRPHNVFLQHGVTKDKNDWLMADRCRFDYFVTATQSEYEFVKKAFGYPESIIHYTGFPRFDNLHDNRIVENQIIIMPTWRKWLRLKSERNVTLKTDQEETDFIRCWKKLLDSEEMEKLIDQYQLKIIFFPHREMQHHIDPFELRNKKITIASLKEFDIQELLKSSQIMITDYSSVYFDMFYMRKPVIFYQFDEEIFRKYHYEEGWFDYHNNPFGKSYSDYREVLSALEQCIRSGYTVSETFLEAHKREFALYDHSNSKRIYDDLRKQMTG